MSFVVYMPHQSLLKRIYYRNVHTQLQSSADVERAIMYTRCPGDLWWVLNNTGLHTAGTMHVPLHKVLLLTHRLAVHARLWCSSQTVPHCVHIVFKTLYIVCAEHHLTPFVLSYILSWPFAQCIFPQWVVVVALGPHAVIGIVSTCVSLAHLLM